MSDNSTTAHDVLDKGSSAKYFGIEAAESHDEDKDVPTGDPRIVATESHDECVICLQPIEQGERAVAVPCNHLNFDFICLASWVQEHSQCPLCKTELSTVQYDWRDIHDYKTYRVKSTKPAPPANPSLPPQRASWLPGRRVRFHRPGYPSQRYRPQPTLDISIQRRRYVYRKHLHSLHVGSNRISQFRDFTPQVFHRSQELQARARKWIRRELQVFDFLSPDSVATPGTAAARRRAENAEFLLIYIVSILGTVDIKGATGKAEGMLGEYLGPKNARLFLHELGAWLRSPYTLLEDWDRHVQYRHPLPSFGVERKGSEVDHLADLFNAQGSSSRAGAGIRHNSSGGLAELRFAD